MTNEEFSNEFDTLLNSYSIINPVGIISNNSSIELDEYEKSILLTQAQEQIVIEFYNGNYNLSSFEETEDIRRYLSSLIKTYSTEDKKTNYIGLSEKSVFFTIPDDLLFITYESVNLKDERLGCLDNKEVLVIPIIQDSYYRIIRNPFRKPSNKRVLRLDYDKSTVELISEYNISRYLIRYLSKPSPIILSDLPDNLSINNISTKTECELNSILHRSILDRAVKLAIQSKSLVKQNV